MARPEHRFSDRVAIVTGAGSGLGRATASLLAREGAAVGGLDIAGDAVEKTAAEIGEAGGTGRAYQVDVRDPAAVEDVIAQVAGDLGRPAIVVNAAGVGRFGHSHEFPPEDWERIVAINLSGTFFVCLSLYTHLTLPTIYSV